MNVWSQPFELPAEAIVAFHAQIPCAERDSRPKKSREAFSFCQRGRPLRNETTPFTRVGLSFAMHLNGHSTGGPVNVYSGAALVVLKVNATARGAPIRKKPNAPAAAIDDL